MENWHRNCIKTSLVIPVIAVIIYIALDFFSLPDTPYYFTPDQEQLKDGDEPVIVWWHRTSEQLSSYYVNCGGNRCYVSENRTYQNHPRTKVFLFYGTFLRPYDLPLPRLPEHEWGLLHDESPKNNYLFSHAEMMQLFNHTSTFKRESDYPIPTHILPSIEWLERKQYLKSTNQKNVYLSELAPVAYIQSDCEAPSGRDGIVEEFMKYMKVDSYGRCLHNKDLPNSIKDPVKGMSDPEFYELVSKYKFVFAMENSICDDYITEKLWRPLHVGTVPIVLGSPKVKDFLPSNLSAIIVQDFESVKKLTNYIKSLNEDDTEYEKYLAWKHNGVENTYLKQEMATRTYSLPKPGFECFVCNRLHENKKRKQSGKPELVFQASKGHYGCPGPVYYTEGKTKFDKNRPMVYFYYISSFEVQTLRHFLNIGEPFTDDDFYEYLQTLTRSNEQLRRVN